jgi:hypothetical protein
MTIAFWIQRGESHCGTAHSLEHSGFMVRPVAGSQLKGDALCFGIFALAHEPML